MNLKLVDEEKGNLSFTTKFTGYIRKEIKTGDDPNGVQIKIIIPVKIQERKTGV